MNDSPRIFSADTILRALMSNEHISLGDLVYNIRESEGKGWDGPSVKAWSDAVSDAEKWMKINGK